MGAPAREGVSLVTTYWGEVREVVGWEKRWVKFSVREGPNRNGFFLWVPLVWATLGISLHIRHFIFRALLSDRMPSLPTVTRDSLQTQRHETTQAEISRIMQGTGMTGSRFSEG